MLVPRRPAASTTPAHAHTQLRTHARTNETNPISRSDSPPNLRYIYIYIYIYICIFDNGFAGNVLGEARAFVRTGSLVYKKAMFENGLAGIMLGQARAFLKMGTPV